MLISLQVLLTRKKFIVKRCVQFVISWVNLDFRQFGLVCCNAATLITDLVCALFRPHAAMFVNQMYPGKSMKTSFVSPGKPWNFVFASPGKS